VLRSGRRLVGGVALAGVVYGLVVRTRLVRWGASDEEVARTFPGQELIPGGTRAATMAITIEAPPGEVWPWLVQMGWNRAGWYSWDRLETEAVVVPRSSTRSGRTSPSAIISRRGPRAARWRHGKSQPLNYNASLGCAA